MTKPRACDTHYITGITALNIPAPDGRQPDWHSNQIWISKRFKQAGIDIICPIKLLGDQGLWDASAVFSAHDIKRKDGQAIYCALPERAIIDWAWSLLKEKKTIYFTLNDFIEEEFDRKLLSHYAAQLKHDLTDKHYKALQTLI